MADEWVTVASVGDVVEGEPKAVETMGHQLALYLVEGVYYCTDNVCSHAYALLSEGWLDEHVIECPLHAGQFDIRTGKGLGPPIDRDIRAYAVRVEGEAIQVSL